MQGGQFVIRYYIIFKGRVQGVGFRAFMQMQAIKYDCSGHVRNLSNGHVEAELQGSKENISNILQILNQGNMFIHVEDYHLKEIPTIAETSFNVLY